MSDVIAVEVKNLPGARFFGFFAMFPNIAENEFNSWKGNVDNENTRQAGLFDYACRQWLSDATIARAAGSPLPPKPISPASGLVVREVLPDNGGTWIAETTGPVFGVCPDLPALVKPDPGITGLVPTGTPAQPTMDQKLDSIASLLASIAAALKKQGIM